MNFIKKQAAGFYLMLLALILGTAGIVFYVINCNTAYFSNLGISWGVVGCLVAGVVLELLFVAGQEKSPEMPALDILPILAGSAFDGRICIFCPPESEQYCDYFIV